MRSTIIEMSQRNKARKRKKARAVVTIRREKLTAIKSPWLSLLWHCFCVSHFFGGWFPSILLFLNEEYTRLLYLYFSLHVNDEFWIEIKNKENKFCFL